MATDMLSACGRREALPVGCSLVDWRSVVDGCGVVNECGDECGVAVGCGDRCAMVVEYGDACRRWMGVV